MSETHSKPTSTTQASRRTFLKTGSLAAAAGATLPYVFTAKSAYAQEGRSANSRPTVGCIATGDRWQAVGSAALQMADCVAICDVDENRLTDIGERIVRQRNGENAVKNLKRYKDYRELLTQDGIDFVTIVTPDHWHSLPVIDALNAGKDVYCEKPLTLTIHEGKQILKTLDGSGRVMQVGTQQRTGMGQRFLKSVAMVKNGRIGELKKVTCCINGVSPSGPIPVADVPAGLDWDMWHGPVEPYEYRYKEGGRWGSTRGHYEFRWWYEYSGGKMTDWGAHHVDIAQWAIGQNGPEDGPTSIEPVMQKHDVTMKDGQPVETDRYNVATEFDVKVMFPANDLAPEGVEMRIVSDSPDGNGILFEGTKGRFHVNRQRMKGAPVDELESNPITQEQLEEVYGGPLPDAAGGDGTLAHMQNFINCIGSRETPVSDVASHHKAMCTCHLANIAVRLDAPLDWDAKTEQITNNDTAQAMQRRKQRDGYTIDVEV